MHAKITGVGSYLPDQVIKNDDITKMLNTTHEWIVKRTGIQKRHLSSTQETSAFMAAQAAKQALEAANLTTVDMIVVATTTPDSFFPSTACLVQSVLELPNCPAFDISAACTGFSYAMKIAEQFIRTGQCQHVLVVGSDTMSRMVDWLDKNTAILFGDGAGACILSASDTPGMIASHLYAEGNHGDLLYANNVRSADNRMIKMQGAPMFKHAVTKMGDAIETLLHEQKLNTQDIDWFIPHQGNIRIINALLERFDLPEACVVNTLENHANTSSASIPIALHQLLKNKQLKRGQLILLSSFGAGMTWGASLIRY